MKRCPECRRDYYDDSLLFCLDDGSRLLEGPAFGPTVAAETLILAGRGANEIIPANTINRAKSPADDLYFEAKFYSGRDNEEDNQKAIELLEKAVELDPEHALSHIELARAYASRGFHFESDAKALLAKSHACLQRAFRIGSHLAEAHELQGFLIWNPAHGFPHEQAIAAYRTAISLDPNLVDAHHWAAAAYFHIGLFKEAEAEIRKTLELDPGKNLARLHAGMVSSYAGRYKEALRTFRALPGDLSPQLVAATSAWCLLNIGRVDEATDLIRRTQEKHTADIGGQFAALAAIVHAGNGDAPAADKAIADAVRKGNGFGHYHHTTHFIADAYAIMGRAQEAVEYLEYTADNGFPCYPLFEKDPSLNGIRSDAAFKEFLSEQRAVWEGRVAKFGCGDAEAAETARFRRPDDPAVR